jgi:CheY-like chemotaxis protein
LKAAHHTLHADAVRLQQIFWNVLKNAVKFTPAGGKINVQTSSDAADRKVTIKITDTGIGMTPEEMTRAFNAFSQGEHSSLGSPHRFGGLGLGLTISRMLVELLFGTIKAESPGRNKGTTFTLEFPFMEGAIPSRRETSAQPVANHVPQKKGLRILLVEDHEPTRAALVYLLTRRNYKVAIAGSAAEARRISREENFDLVLSDIGLPDGNGYELMSEFRENFGLKGIALTGYGMDQDVALAKKAGFITHLTKPIDMETLDRALSDFK